MLIEQKNTSIKKETFNEFPISIGRDPGNGLILNSKNVSRFHARIFFENNDFFIEDCDSSNGVWVLENKIKKEKITPNQSIRIGDFNIKCTWDFNLLNKSNLIQNKENTRLEEESHVLKNESKKYHIEIVLKKNDISKILTFKKEILSVGRDLKNDIVLNDDLVSRNHAFFEKKGNDLIISDLNSKNGIKVNGLKINKHVLKHEDIIEVGSFFIKAKILETTQNEETRVVSLEDLEKKRDKFFSDKKVKIFDEIKKEENKCILKAVFFYEGNKKEFFLNKKINFVGRDESLDIFLDYKFVSKKHFSIQFNQKEVIVEDLDSSNGVFYKGKKIKKINIKNKEEIHIGDAKIQFLWENKNDHVEEIGSYQDDDSEEEVEKKASFFLSNILSSSMTKSESGVNKINGLLEVMSYEDNNLIDVSLVEPGSSYYIGPRSAGVGFDHYFRDIRIKIFEVLKNNTCFLYSIPNCKIHIKRYGINKDVSYHDKKPIAIDSEDVIFFEENGTTIVAKFVHKPFLKSGLFLKNKKKWMLISSLISFFSFAIHGMLLYLVGSFTETPHVERKKSISEFTEVRLSDVFFKQKEEIKEPKPQPVVVEKKNIKIKKQYKKYNENKILKKTEIIKNTQIHAKPKEAQGVLGLLKKVGSVSKVSNVAVAGTNIVSAKSHYPSSGYKVSGMTTKLSTEEISIGDGDGSLVKGSASLLRSSEKVLNNNTHVVEGVVKSSSKLIKTKGGTLDREEIDKVVNRYVEKIQRCYQRELSKNPTLSGKINVEWVIGEDGYVKSARQTYSDMKSQEVSECILELIRSWQFSKPEGGEVTVNFPWIFKGF